MGFGQSGVLYWPLVTAHRYIAPETATFTSHFLVILFITFWGSFRSDSIRNRVQFLAEKAKRIGIAQTRYCRNRPSTKPNSSILDITLSMNLPRLHKIQNWKVSEIPSGSDHSNITFGYVAGAPLTKEVRLGRNYHRADWDEF
jgi:hypothetical protein